MQVMARTSKYEHLKSSILEQFALGKSVSEVSRAFPDVPQRTLYEWIKLRETHSVPPVQDLQNKSQTITVQAIECPAEHSASDSANSAKLKIVPFRERSHSVERVHTKEETEFEIAVRTLKDIAEDYNAPQAVRVQSAIALLKVAQLKLETPAIALNGEQDAIPDVASEREKLKDLDASELRRKYLDALG